MKANGGLQVVMKEQLKYWESQPAVLVSAKKILKCVKPSLVSLGDGHRGYGTPIPKTPPLKFIFGPKSVCRS